MTETTPEEIRWTGRDKRMPWREFGVYLGRGIEYKPNYGYYCPMFTLPKSVYETEDSIMRAIRNADRRMPRVSRLSDCEVS